MVEKSKILIIDDEEVVLDSCSQILEGSEYNVSTALNGTIGLDLVREFQPDLVYVDLKMPGISGFEVLDKIHSMDSTIVSIVITGYATVNSAVEAMKKSAYDFLPKPFTPDEFRLITRRGLEKRKLVLETIALRKEKEILRDQFAAIVSHELKSPLIAIRQNLYSLVEELSEKITDSQRGKLDRMQTRIDDLLNLINTWLRVISVDIAKIQESFKPVNLSGVINKAIESVQPHALRKNIDLIVAIDEPLNPLLGDEGTLTEALINVLGNAVKYSYTDSQVSLKAEEKEASLLITVSDNGVGIAAEDLPHIFEDFYAGKTVPGIEKGTGLGLAITQRIVEAHHGNISAHSKPGKGSTFTISLPMRS